MTGESPHSTIQEKSSEEERFIVESRANRYVHLMALCTQGSSTLHENFMCPDTYWAQLQREVATMASRRSFAMFNQWTARPCCFTTNRHVNQPQNAQLCDLREPL